MRILRPVEGTSRRYVIEVDVAELFEGKGLDVPLHPGDIVYVPRSYTPPVLADFLQRGASDVALHPVYCRPLIVQSIFEWYTD